MLSFHNDPAIKQKYLDRLKHHMEMDNIIQGTGWENGKGCAVGCTLENYDHSRYTIELGLPVWIAYLEDRIFEGLENKKSKFWPYNFLNSIPVGVDVEIVKHKLAIKRLNRLIEIQEKLLLKNENLSDVINKVICSVKLVISCHECELNHESCNWSEAWSAEGSAVWSAESAWSAASATSEARSEKWEQEANDLIELLKELGK